VNYRVDLIQRRLLNALQNECLGLRGMLSFTKAKTELEILAVLERGEVISQSTIAHRLGVAVGLTNAVLKRAIRKGYVKVRTVPLRRYAYFVTPTGFVEKGRLVADYLEASLGFFRQARAQYSEVFEALHTSGVKTVALYGMGELAEIALLAAAENGVTLVGIVDPSANVDTQLGLPIVQRFEDLKPCTAIVITDSRAPQTSYDVLKASNAQLQVRFPPLLRIVTDRAELLKAAAELEIDKVKVPTSKAAKHGAL
jgi:DNA-binding MarR family transcriptional regulator